MGSRDRTGTSEDEGNDPRGSGRGRFAAGTPDDVAALYTWANLQGARYRDFSASRRRYREQIRSLASDDPVAQIDSPESPVGYPVEVTARLEPIRTLEQVEPEAARVLWRDLDSSAKALEERRKGGSAVRWAANQREWESSSRSLNAAEFSPRTVVGSASHEPVAAAVLEKQLGTEADGLAAGSSAAEQMGEVSWDRSSVESDPLYEGASELWSDEKWERVGAVQQGSGAEARIRHGATTVAAWNLEEEPEFEVDRPAWLFGAQWEGAAPANVPGPRFEAAPEAEVPARVESRWSALRDVFETSRASYRIVQAPIAVGRRAPLLIVFSLAGGVGRTSLLATLGRALSASGERVVLGDAAPYSLLPFYFGARNLRPGEMRAFAPPEGSEDSPIFLVNYDVARPGTDAGEQKHMVGEILRNGAECHRILLDLPAGSEWLIRRLATLQPTVLVPLMPDMTSVISLEAVERYFEGMVDADGIPVQPFYVLNQFDSSMALHLDVRELLRERLRDRLLSFVIRRSGAVSEALAEGMTVADYAPEGAVTRDYFDVAAWLRTVSPPTMGLARSGRSGRG